MKDWLRALLMVALIGVGILGFIGLFHSRHLERSHLAGPSAVVIAAAAAGLVTLSATATWKEQRSQALARSVQQQREQIYGALAAYSMAQFTGGTITELGQMRAQVVSWSSPAILQAMGKWNATVDGLTKYQVAGTNRYEFPPEVHAHVRQPVCELVTALQNELNPGQKATVQQVERALFNDIE